MKKIIDPVDRELLKSELDQDHHLRQTNRAGNELYVVGPESTNVIREIGRLREIAFRNDGGGTGEPLDIDKFDTDPAYGYRQLVLWDPQAEEIIGGYRFCLCDEAVYDRYGQPILTSSHMFEFSRKFLKNYLPHTLELGRSFVSVDYQSSKSGSKSLYALDNLFDGIAALGVLYKDRIKYFFGKMTIYPTYNKEARDIIMYFLKKYFGEKADLIKIRKQVKVENPRRFHRIFTGSDYKENYKILKAEVAKQGVSIPPLVNTYMNMSPTMIYFGTGINDEFADVLDSGILITFDDLYPEKIHRHTNSFTQIGWRAIKRILKRFQRRS
ncbi:MAG: GNAT family N-acetyltransferase [Bacteroidales bacterium]|nr:GNAT family N-acetyltransferase [Bacteroidales bacterium]MBR1794308.1 GNAT family N-acetyltransferase [Bacteroidales bacterium]